MQEAASKHHISEAEKANERELVEASQKDPSRFRPLYDKYFKKIFLFIHQRLDDKDLAFDTTQQVFLKAMERLKDYEYRGLPFGSWLFRIAKSETYQLFRDRKAERTVNIETLQLKELVAEITEDPYASYRDKLIELIRKLEEEDLQLVEMRFFEGRSFREIGEIMDMTDNNAKVKLYRLLHKLKTQLKTQPSLRHE